MTGRAEAELVMLVAEAMNRSPAAVAPDASMAEAAALVRRTGEEHVLVVDEQTLVGILCACDLRGAQGEERVRERMSAPVTTVRPDVRVEEAAATLVERRVGCLPVAVGGLILGIVGAAELRHAGVESPRPRCRHVHRCHARKRS